MKKRKLRKYVFGATAMSVLAGGSLALGAQEAQASSVASFNQISVPYVVEIPEIPKVDIGLPSQQTVSQVISAEELEKHNQPQTVSNTPKIATPVSSPTTIPFVTSITIPASSPAVIPSPDVQAVQDSNIEEIKSAFSIRIGNPDSLKVELPDSIPFGEYVKDRVERERIQREIQEDEALRDIKLTIIDDNGKEVDKTIDHSKPWDKQIPQENITVTIIDGESQEDVAESEYADIDIPFIIENTPFIIESTPAPISINPIKARLTEPTTLFDTEEYSVNDKFTSITPITAPAIDYPTLDEQISASLPKEINQLITQPSLVTIPTTPISIGQGVKAVDPDEFIKETPFISPTIGNISFTNTPLVVNEPMEFGNTLLISHPVITTIATPIEEEVRSAVSVRLSEPLEPLKVDVVEKSFSPIIDIQLPEEKNSNPVVGFFGQLIGKIFVAMAN